jgi:hypothetical protein
MAANEEFMNAIRQDIMAAQEWLRLNSNLNL